MSRITKSVLAPSGRKGLLMPAVVCTAPAPPGEVCKVAGGPPGYRRKWGECAGRRPLTGAVCLLTSWKTDIGGNLDVEECVGRRAMDVDVHLSIECVLAANRRRRVVHDSGTRAHNRREFNPVLTGAGHLRCGAGWNGTWGRWARRRSCRARYGENASDAESLDYTRTVDKRPPKHLAPPMPFDELFSCFS